MNKLFKIIRFPFWLIGRIFFYLKTGQKPQWPYRYQWLKHHVELLQKVFVAHPINSTRFFRPLIKGDLSNHGYALAVCGPRILTHVAQACRQADVKPFLLFGTLRGFVLKNDFLPKSEDIDFGLLDHDFQKRAPIKEFLLKKGYTCPIDDDGQLQFVHPQFPDLCIEFFRLYEENKKRTLRVSDYEINKYHFYSFPMNILNNFQKVKFKGIDVLVPTKGKDFLIAHYAEFWNNPPQKPNPADQKHRKVEKMVPCGVILMYHRVIDLDLDPWRLCVSVKNFEEHLKIIKKHGIPVTMQEMNQSLKSCLPGKKNIAITFDDGYADNYHNAASLLKQYQIPATFYITTGAIDSTQEFWWDEIGRLILAPMRLPARFELTTGPKKYQWNIQQQPPEKTITAAAPPEELPLNNSTLSRVQLYFAVWRILSRLPMDEKSAILTKIAQWAGQGTQARKDHLAMTSQELMDLGNSPLFEIGGHTVKHPMLSQLTRKEQHNEIAGSKIFLENRLKRQITSFAYPHGDQNTETLQVMKDLGFINACTVVERAVLPEANSFLLPRFMVLNWNAQEFEQHLLKWLNIDE